MASMFWRLFAPDLNGPYDAPLEQKRGRNLVSRLFHSDTTYIIKNIDQALEEDLNNLKNYVRHFNKKVRLIDNYMHHKLDLARVTEEIQEINRLISDEKKIEADENRIVLKSIKTIDKVLENEKDIDYKLEEQEIRQELTSLSDILSELDPLLEKQQKFLSSRKIDQRELFGEFVKLVNKEAHIIGSEKQTMQDMKHEIERFEAEEIMTK